MRDISIYLYSFIKKIRLYDKNSNDNNKLLIQDTSYNKKDEVRILIDNIINDLNTAKVSFLDKSNNIIAKINEIKIIDGSKSEYFPKGNSFTGYVDSTIKEKIKTSIKYGREYTLSFNNNNNNSEQKIKINLIYCLDEKIDSEFIKSITPEKMQRKFDEYIYKIYLWFHVANKQRNILCSENMSVYIYMTNLIKLIENNSKIILDRRHSNSAFTTSCQKTTEIHIYREEDWFKTLIHETFHCFGFDFSHSSKSEEHQLSQVKDISNNIKTTSPNLDNYSKDKILDIFSVKSDVNLFETYCEVWGELLNLIIYLWMEPLGFNIDKFYELLFYEQQFSLFQCAKVLKHNNLTYNDMKFNTKRFSKEFKENTNILSYYILKSIYLYYINKFIVFISNQNVSTPFKFNYTEKNMNNYINIISSKYGETSKYDSVFEERIKDMEKYLKKNENTEKIEMITMKMNILDG